MRKHAGDTMPSVSVVVPACNASATVDRTIESLRRQSMPDWEALVIDDGSIDGTASTIERHAAEDGRITLIRQENAGARSEEHTSELQSLMRISSAVFCMTKNK